MDVTYMENLKNGYDMLYLAACALQDIAPEDAAVKAMDLEGVYVQAEKQMLLAITCYSVERWLKQAENATVDPQLLEKWKEAKNKAIRKNMLLDLEREKIIAYMEEQHIWHMPLKGSILKDLYPALGMRQMSDNDILVDPNCRKDLYTYMTGRGYKGEYQENDNHDVYLKAPVYNFEIHNALFSDTSDPNWTAYYQNLKDRLSKDANKEYGFHFQDEDFYIYMVLHAYNHHTHSGNGVRHLMDVQVYLNQKPEMDWDYIRDELVSLGVADYESTVRSLAGKLFNKQCVKLADLETMLTAQERELLEFGICVGTYGNREVWTQNNLRRSTNGESVTIFGKIKYLWKRMVYLEGLYSYYPRLANYKILRPFLYVGRIFVGITQYGSRLWPEIKTLLKIKR